MKISLLVTIPDAVVDGIKNKDMHGEDQDLALMDYVESHLSELDYSSGMIADLQRGLEQEASALLFGALAQVAKVGGMDRWGFASANALANADDLAEQVMKALMHRREKVAHG